MEARAVSDPSTSFPGSSGPPQASATDALGPIDCPTAQLDELAAALAADDHPARIGRYHIVEPLGEGGMGVVYRAEQRHPVHRIVALKLIKLGMDSKAVI